MNDVEIANLIENYEAFIRKTARMVWGEAGEPEGIRPEDLHNAGFAALLEVADECEDPGNLALFASIRVRDRMRNHLKQLQVGAVTWDEVQRPDGTVGRLVYSASADVAAIEDPFSFEQDQDEGERSEQQTHGRGLLRKLQKRINRTYRDPQAASAARVDYARAVASIPVELDRFTLHIFEQVQLRAPGDTPERVWGFLNDSWRRRKTALAVTQDVLRNHASPDQVAAHLERAAAWINAYCGGRPMTVYPALRTFQP